MKISLIAAQTIDGFIARTSDEFASWTSKEDKKRFVRITKSVGTIILGSKTFDTFPGPLPDRTHIIYSRDPEKYEKKLLEKFGWESLPREIEVTNKPVTQLLNDLRKENKDAIVCGGSEIYSLFISAGVINTLYLTIEPVIFGTGIPLFKTPVEYRANLTSLEKTDSGTIFLEYQLIQNQ